MGAPNDLIRTAKHNHSHSNGWTDGLGCQSVAILPNPNKLYNPDDPPIRDLGPFCIDPQGWNDNLPLNFLVYPLIPSEKSMLIASLPQYG